MAGLVTTGCAELAVGFVMEQTMEKLQSFGKGCGQ